MKCPKCGSEKIQFGTNTEKNGFSLSNSCCGTIALGPLGFLCGFLGTGTSTEEFWICQDCGNKFTTEKSQAKEEQDNKDSQEYAKNKAIMGNKSHEEIYEQNKKAHDDYDNAVSKYEDLLKRYAKSEDKQLRKSAKILRKEWTEVVAWILLVIVGIVAILKFLDATNIMDAFIGFIPVGICGLYIIIYKKRFKKAEETIKSVAPQYSYLRKNKGNAYSKAMKSDEQVSASKKAQKYEKKH